MFKNSQGLSRRVCCGHARKYCLDGCRLTGRVCLSHTEQIVFKKCFKERRPSKHYLNTFFMYVHGIPVRGAYNHLNTIFQYLYSIHFRAACDHFWILSSIPFWKARKHSKTILYGMGLQGTIPTKQNHHHLLLGDRAPAPKMARALIPAPVVWAWNPPKRYIAAYTPPPNYIGLPVHILLQFLVFVVCNWNVFQKETLFSALWEALRIWNGKAKEMLPKACRLSSQLSPDARFARMPRISVQTWAWLGHAASTASYIFVRCCVRVQYMQLNKQNWLRCKHAHTELQCLHYYSFIHFKT